MASSSLPHTYDPTNPPPGWRSGQRSGKFTVDSGGGVPSSHHPHSRSGTSSQTISPSPSVTPSIPSTSHHLPQYPLPLPMEHFNYATYHRPPTFPSPSALSPQLLGGYVLQSPTLQQGFMGMSLQGHAPSILGSSATVGNPVKPEDFDKGLPGLVPKEQLHQQLKEKQSAKEKERERRKKSSQEKEKKEIGKETEKGKGKEVETEVEAEERRQREGRKLPGDLRSDLGHLEAELDSFQGSVGTFKEESLDSYGVKDVATRKEKFVTPYQIRKDLAGLEFGGDEFLKEDDPLAAKVWRLFVKARKTLPNGERMENLTWRMMGVNLKNNRREVDEREKETEKPKGVQVSQEENEESLRRVSFDEAEERRGRRGRGSASTSHSPPNDVDPDAMDWRAKSQSRSRSRMDWMRTDTISMDWRAQSKSRSRSRATIGNRISLPQLGHTSFFGEQNFILESNEEGEEKKSSPEGQQVHGADDGFGSIEDTINQLINLQSLENNSTSIPTSLHDIPSFTPAASSHSSPGKTHATIFKNMDPPSSTSSSTSNLKFLLETRKGDRDASSTVDNGVLDPQGLGFGGFKAVPTPFPQIPQSLHYPQPETSLGLQRGLKHSPLVLGGLSQGLSQSLPNPGFRHPLPTSTPPVTSLDSYPALFAPVGQPHLGAPSGLSLARPPDLSMNQFPPIDSSSIPIPEEMKSAFTGSFSFDGSHHPPIEALYPPHWPHGAFHHPFLPPDMLDPFAPGLGVSPHAGDTSLVGSFDSVGPTLVNLSQVQTNRHHGHFMSESEASFTFSPNSLLSGESSRNGSPSPPVTRTGSLKLTKRGSLPNKASLAMSSITDSKSKAGEKLSSNKDLGEGTSKKRSNSIGEVSLAGKVAAARISDKNSSSDIPMVCGNCRTSNTPLWRRDAEGRPLCNACGLFRNLHGVDRPLSLNTGIVKKRNRAKGTKDPSKRAAASRNRKQSMEDQPTTNSRQAARNAASPYPPLALNHHLRSHEMVSSESSTDSSRPKPNS
ncbi:hypothetical protein BT69DRAFT_1341738 [Atractiella rhizophila]|nr:hypothetical protein BT69DRAFT_1341738 [Atractiella rhizophila]